MNLQPPQETLTEETSSGRPRPFSLSSVLVILAAIGVFAAAYLLTSRPQMAVNNEAVGAVAPEVDLIELFAATPASASSEDAVTVTGKPTSGRVTVLHFWGTWCPPCKLEYPHLVELIQKHQANPALNFLTVSCESGPGETLEGIREKTLNYYDKIGVTGLQTFVDARGKTRQAAANTIGKKSMVYPTTIIIGTDQKVTGVWQGYSEKSLVEMEAMIDTLLAGAA